MLVPETLDKAVATAYVWIDYASESVDMEILQRLLILSKRRSEK